MMNIDSKVNDEAPDVQKHLGTLDNLFEDVYYSVIIDHVKFPEILPKMTFMREFAGEIYALDIGGKSKHAGVFFMRKLMESDEPGKYQTFLEALKELDYCLIVEAIENGGISQNHEEHKQILEIFCRRLMDSIDPSLMANEMFEQKVISRMDLDKIQNTVKNHSSEWASFQLIDTLPRRHKNWYKIFWDKLYDLGQHELCEEIDPKFYDLRKEEENRNSSSGSQVEEDSIPNLEVPFGNMVDRDLRSPQFSEQPNVAVNINTDIPEMKCNCSCRDKFDSKIEELKEFFEPKLNSLEMKLNHQTAMIKELLDRLDKK